MKLFEIFYKKTKIRQEEKISILCGLISFEKFLPIYKEIKILGKSVLRKSSYNYVNQKKMATEIFPTAKIVEEVKEDCLHHIVKQAPQDFENIVYIRSGLGETYLLNLYLEQIMENIGFDIKKTCFVGSRDTFGEIFKQYNPNVTYKKIKINWDYLCLGINDSYYEHNGKKIYFYVNKNFVYKLMDNYRDGVDKTNFAKKIAELFSINKERLILKRYLPTDIEKSKAIDYLWKNKINKNNFIFISQEAVSIEELSDDFWTKLESALREKGFDIFYNSKAVSITQAKIIASLSKGIVALRSGFSETLVELNIPSHVVYTSMKINGISAQNLLNVYSLKDYPYEITGNVFEYDNETMSEEEILDGILKGF